MGDILRLDSDRHGEIRALLPWYVTGRLEPEEHARVVAHLASCPECRTEARVERRLGMEVAQAPVELELGWQEMRRRIAAERPPAGALAALRGAGLGAAVAAQAVLLIALGGWLVPRLGPAPYHALAAAPAPATANVLIMFRAGSSEGSVRLALAAVGGRVTDGPTRAGAWMVHVATADRQRALATLRARPEVSLAQPVDPATGP
ncbi:MAG TPA: zf-HC2 domain-containing protein [Caulobacteraceae bacterium]|nr:zf-HC2 domain-containing protein [Caulobacteraceae bacterium]